MEAKNVIHKGDKILAMLTRNGKVIAQLPPMIDVHSINDVIAQLKGLCHSPSGLTQLFIRNFTQGWHIDTLLYLSVKPEHTTSPIVNENGQYCFAF